MNSLTILKKLANQKEQLSTVERFYERAPKKPYCTDLKGSGLIIRTKKSAFTRSYVQHNPPAMCHWLTFDQDHDDLLRWEDARLPTPNLIVRNLENRRAHISYAIESVCTSEAARPKPLAYLQAIEAVYCEKLNADPNYANFLTKNPFHENWHLWELHDHVYSLGELADYVELKNRYWTRNRACNEDHYGLGRNCALFHRLRFWAYDWVTHYRDEGHASYSQWLALVLEKCEGYNDFMQPLPYAEVKATAKSVGKWVWTKYFPKTKRKRRGAMEETFAQCEIDLSLQDKQRLSVRRTHEIRRTETEKKIIDAIGQLIAAGKKPAKAAVARVAGLSRTQISMNYSHLFRE